MSQVKLTLTAFLAASVIGVVAGSASAADSVIVQPSFGGAKTSGGATLTEPNGAAIPVASGNNNVYIYSSGQTGVYNINFSALASVAAGEQFGSVEFGLSGSSGLTLGAYAANNTSGSWFSNGGVLVNGSFGPNPSTLTEIAASVGPSFTQPTFAITSPAAVGSVAVTWNGLTAETLKISDGNGNIGQVQASAEVTSTGQINPGTTNADTWTVNFVPLFSADTNYDGKVGQADFGVIAGNFGTHVTNGVSGGALFAADNGNVGQDDFGALAGQFGSVFAPGLITPGSLVAGAVVATPEPASLGLLALGGVALIARRRKA